MNRYYAAGFFDGEGCVGVTYIKRDGSIPYYIVSAKIANTNKPILEAFKAHWGGSIFRLGSSGKVNCKPAWYWRIAAQKAKRFILDIRPYLHIKGPIADLGVKLIDIQSFMGKRFAPDELAYQAMLRHRIWDDMRKLNQRGLAPWQGIEAPNVEPAPCFGGGKNRTHCFNGHPWVAENLLTIKIKGSDKVQTRCHLCVKEQHKRYQAKVRAQRRTLRQVMPEATLLLPTASYAAEGA